MTIEDGQLLRRLIARRCIYGVDLNSIAVQLARLAVWIHTFVPGLPLSILDHNLVHGNALIGIGNLAEIEDKLTQPSFSRKEAKSGDSEHLADVFCRCTEPAGQGGKTVEAACQHQRCLAAGYCDGPRGIGGGQ